MLSCNNCNDKINNTFQILGIPQNYYLTPAAGVRSLMPFHVQIKGHQNSRVLRACDVSYPTHMQGVHKVRVRFKILVNFVTVFDTTNL